MNRLLIVIVSILAVGTSILMFPVGPPAALLWATLLAAVLVFLSKQDDSEFLLKFFLIALILRTLASIGIYVFVLQDFFGPDSWTYDYLGNVMSHYWMGELPAEHPDVVRASGMTQSGWGIHYIVGAIYLVTGQNQLAIQFFCAVIGAATSPITYLCAKEIFSNKRVARISAIIVAFSPSLILWSSQGLKDGIIVFFLVLSVLNVIKLQKKFNYLSFILLMISLLGIISLRFYIFYMLVAAIIGCFAIGEPFTPASVLRRVAVLAAIGLTLSSFGNRSASDLGQFNLAKVQNTREDLARGNAGFGRDLDVSTTEGAITALPVGLTYLMLAPFPWQVGNVRQAITLPEMILWWASIPFLITGLWYTIKHRLRNSIAVLLFTLMLTFAYSLYQGNIGTAYRQRAQIQIFHFMFIAAGLTLWLEKKENKKAQLVLQRNAGLKKSSRKENFLLPGR